jgi:hypothetical protein
VIVQPCLERGEVEDEARDDDGRVVDGCDLDDALAVRGSESIDGGTDPVAHAGVVDVVDHDDGAGGGERVEGSDAAVGDLLEDLVPFVELSAGHVVRCESGNANRGWRGPACRRSSGDPRGRTHVSGRRPGG